MRKPLSIVIVGLIVGTTSCEQQRGCTDFASPNYNPDAIVDDGSCQPINTAFLGIWRVESDCSDAIYFRTITAHSDRFGISLTNLGQNLGSVNARISENSITIPVQSLGAFHVVEGAGILLDGNTMRVSYRVRDSSNGSVRIYDCMDDMTKVQ